MNGDTLIIRGKKYRVEANWNAVMAFLAARGTNSLAALQCLDNITPLDATLLMACCINEGERLEGRQADLSLETFGAMSPAEVAGCIGQFLQIYIRQSTPDVPVDKPKKD